MQEAQFYRKYKNDLVKCMLCPWFCELKPGQIGVCKVRENLNGTLVTHVYNQVATMGIDPVEKKPLYHFYPGSKILSIGEVGCNLFCAFCQNHRISQCFAAGYENFSPITSEQLVNKALHISKNCGIAYTYNEPFTFYEFMLHTSKLAHENGLKNAVISNGYVNIEPLQKILPFTDAFNIDLKAFDEAFYKKQTKGKLNPVLETLKVIAKSRKHLEITFLIIPELNDEEKKFEAMVQWISSELGPDIPLHLSRFFPQYKLQHSPTPLSTLENLFLVASKHLKYIYLGNVNDERKSSTFCPSCGDLLIERNHYHTKILQPDFSGRCINCGTSANILMN